MNWKRGRGDRGPGGSGRRKKGADVGRRSSGLWGAVGEEEGAGLARGGRRVQRGGLAYSEWCGKRPGAASRSSPRAAGSVPRGPATGSRSRSWPRTSLARGPALSWRGRGPSFRRRRPGKRSSWNSARRRTASRAGAHPGPEASPLCGGVRENCAEAGPRDFRRRGGTSGFVAEVAGAVPWPENSAGRGSGGRLVPGRKLPDLAYEAGARPRAACVRPCRFK